MQLMSIVWVKLLWLFANFDRICDYPIGFLQKQMTALQKCDILLYRSNLPVWKVRVHRLCVEAKKHFEINERRKWLLLEANHIY